MRSRLPYLLLASITLAAGLAILAFAPHVPILRGFASDVIVVMFIYGLARLVYPWRPVPLAITIFVVGAVLEVCQYFHLAQRLAVGGVLGVMIGSTFDVMDLLAYAIGLGVVLTWEWRVARGR